MSRVLVLKLTWLTDEEVWELTVDHHAAAERWHLILTRPDEDYLLPDSAVTLARVTLSGYARRRDQPLLPEWRRRFSLLPSPDDLASWPVEVTP